MPELPEVESLVRGVRDELVGHRIVSIDFFRPDIREVIPQKRIKQILLGHAVVDVFRRGKYMLIATGEGYLGVHLGMSGRFVKSLVGSDTPAHTHAIFRVDQGFHYQFVDARRFGRLFSLEKSDLDSHPFLSSLGVEPLDQNINLAQHLFARSRRRTQSIKIFLMDSKVVVGVGNIYASESLWQANIHPEQRACDVSLKGYEKLASAVADVLGRAIAAGGTTFRDYRDKDGNPGYFQQSLSVYGKASKSCPRCTRTIAKLVQGGRSTFFCPFCQKQKN